MDAEDVTFHSTCFTAATLLLPLYYMQVQKLLDMYCKQKGVDAVEVTFHYSGKELVGSSTPGICSIRQHTSAYVSTLYIYIFHCCYIYRCI
jgi:hypothetical protein